LMKSVHTVRGWPYPTDETFESGAFAPRELRLIFRPESADLWF
jgi:hypothetical protein